ncbi:hypothetical protein MHZ93_08490 [Roseomonas sp. ACRSG]|nr:hypothetical protein [Roseomonas sp. ACRSG]
MAVWFEGGKTASVPQYTGEFGHRTHRIGEVLQGPLNPYGIKRGICKWQRYHASGFEGAGT